MVQISIALPLKEERGEEKAVQKVSDLKYQI